jgi:putative ABC transport system substrate-binding protein
MLDMRRREFVALLGSAAAAWPLAARAQRPAMPVVGFLSARSADDSVREVVAFQEGLAVTGHLEGRNVVIEYRWAQGEYGRLPALALELVRQPVAVLAAVGGIPSPLAAKAAATTTPIVFGIGGDPVEWGLVASLNRPGGNVTGATFLSALLGAKRLGLIRELVPGAELIALLVNPDTLSGQAQTKDVQQAARAVGQRLVVLNGGTDESMDESFAVLAKQRVAALLVGGDAFFDVRRDRLIALAARHSVPAIYQFREYALAGGLMSYGASIADMYRQVGVYVGRRREARRFAGGAADKIRDQPQDRKGARFGRAQLDAIARRRGDRIKASFASAQKRRRSRCSGIHADPQHTLTICSDFLVTDRAMEAWYRLLLQTPNRRVRWQATSDDENS